MMDHSVCTILFFEVRMMFKEMKQLGSENLQIRVQNYFAKTFHLSMLLWQSVLAP